MSKTSKFIPNTFQYPNAYVDRYMALLTPNENVVLTYAIRRIIGFQKDTDRISVAQFANGITSGDGEILDRGTGLGETAVRTAVKGLLKYKLFRVVSKPDPEHNLPAEFGLQWDSAKVDEAGLEQRLAEKRGKDQNRVKPMLETPPVRRSNQVRRTHRARFDGRTSPGSTDDTHNKPVDNQKKTRTPFAPNGAALAEPAEETIRISNELRKHAQDVFQKATGLEPLPATSKKNKSSNASRWWDPLRTICVIGGADPAYVKALIEGAVKDLGRDKVYAPQSILNTIPKIKKDLNGHYVPGGDYEADLERRREEARRALETTP